MIFFKKILILLLLAIALTEMFYLLPLQQEKKGFSLEAISATIPFHPEWEGRTLNSDETQEVEQALLKTYHYLGCGGQCFTFASLDGKYVIKFFKQKKFALPRWIEHFPIPLLIDWLREKKTMKRVEKRNKVFTAFKLSFDQLQDETGLLYVHLNSTKHLNKILSVSDDLGAVHVLNLDGLEFVLQKKAMLAYTAIDTWIETQELDRAKEAIDQLLTLNIALYQKGFRNRDPNFRSNCGFIGSRAILIDVGRVIPSEEIKNPKNYKNELAHITPRFRQYLSKKHPELLAYFDQSLDKILQDEQ